MKYYAYETIFVCIHKTNPNPIPLASHIKYATDFIFALICHCGDVLSSISITRESKYTFNFGNNLTRIVLSYYYTPYHIISNSDSLRPPPPAYYNLFRPGGVTNCLGSDATLLIRDFMSLYVLDKYTRNPRIDSILSLSIPPFSLYSIS